MQSVTSSYRPCTAVYWVLPAASMCRDKNALRWLSQLIRIVAGGLPHVHVIWTVYKYSHSTGGGSLSVGLIYLLCIWRAETEKLSCRGVAWARSAPRSHWASYNNTENTICNYDFRELALSSSFSTSWILSTGQLRSKCSCNSCSWSRNRVSRRNNSRLSRFGWLLLLGCLNHRT